MAITTVSQHVVSVNAIQGTLIADNAITAVHIATNAVSGTLIADNAVTATHIAQNTITVTQIADDAIEAAKLADGIITTNHLNKAMISSQTEVTPVGGDFVLIGDTSDSNNLKKAPLTLLLNSNVDITSKANLSGASFTGDLTITTAGPSLYLVDSDNNPDYQIKNGNGHFRVIDTTNSADRFNIGTTGNVGIGYAGGTAAHPLQISGGLGDAYHLSFDRGNSTPGGDDPWLALYNHADISQATYGWGWYDSSSDGSLQLWNRNNSTTGYVVLSAKRGGNVGIGTASPASPLDIVTNLSSDTQTTPETVLTLATKYSSTGANGGAGAGPRIYFKIPDDETNPSGGASIEALKENADDSVSNTALAFSISQNDETLDEAMRITSDGDVGIGMTPITNSRLSVKTQGDGTYPIRVVNSEDSDMLFGVYESSDGDGNNGMLYLNDGGGNTDVKISTNGDSWLAGGDVGIGTNDPDSRLHIHANSDQQMTLSAAGANDNIGIFFKDDTGNRGELYWRGASDDFRYYNYTKSHEQWVMSDNGKHEFFGAHQGDSVGHFIFSNDGLGDTDSTNCTLMVRNGGIQVQIMPWSTLGARVGTRGGGWASTSTNACYLTSNDASNIILNTNGSPTLANGTAISSDQRLKKDITDIADGQLAKIKALKPRNFKWKDDRKSGNQEGFIAQEVESVMPEAVEERESAPDPDDKSRDFEGNIKVLKHEVINARLIKAVQELSAELEAAKARIKTLEDA